MANELKAKQSRRDSQRCSLYACCLPVAKDGELENHKETELVCVDLAKCHPNLNRISQALFRQDCHSFTARSMQRSSVDFFVEWKQAFSSCSRFLLHSSLPAKSLQKVN